MKNIDTSQELNLAAAAAYLWIFVLQGGRPWEAPGGHRGQFPRTDSGLAAGIYSSNDAARTPKAAFAWGVMSNHISSDPWLGLSLTSPFK